MADGKVMQKYYPPDFDPEALKKNKDVLRSIQRSTGSGKRRRGARMMDMRMMFPFTLCCASCEDFVYVGTKFNSKVERLRGMDYLTIPIWRFYGRCPHCRHQIVFRTDPKNTDYILESGGSRTYDPNRDVGLASEYLKEAQDQQIQEDTVKALEVKSYNTAEELKSMAALDDLRRLNRKLFSKHEDMADFILDYVKEKEYAPEDKEDAAELEEARQHFINRDFDSPYTSESDPDMSRTVKMSKPYDQSPQQDAKKGFALFEKTSSVVKVAECRTDVTDTPNDDSLREELINERDEISLGYTASETESES